MKSIDEFEKMKSRLYDNYNLCLLDELKVYCFVKGCVESKNETLIKLYHKINNNLKNEING